MPISEAQKKASQKYLKESVEDIRIRVPKGQKAIIKAHADQCKESLNAFIVRAIKETMAREQNLLSEPAGKRVECE